MWAERKVIRSYNSREKFLVLKSFQAQQRDTGLAFPVHGLSGHCCQDSEPAEVDPGPSLSAFPLISYLKTWSMTLWVESRGRSGGASCGDSFSILCLSGIHKYHQENLREKHQKPKAHWLMASELTSVASGSNPDLGAPWPNAWLISWYLLWNLCTLRPTLDLCSRFSLRSPLTYTEQQLWDTPAGGKKHLALLTCLRNCYIHQQKNTGKFWVLGGECTESLPPSIYLVLSHLRLTYFGTSEHKENLATFPLPTLPMTRT